MSVLSNDFVTAEEKHELKLKMNYLPDWTEYRYCSFQCS